MTTFYPFVPSYNPPAPSFQPTLDGNPYTITINANLFGQRYYLLCVDSSGNTIFNEPLIQSPESIPISLLSWNSANLTSTVTTQNPHGYSVGTTVILTIENANPTTWNGTFQMLATGANTLTFPLPSFPGQMISAGTLSYLISITGGYFNSTIVFRNSQFEVSP